MGRQAKGFGCSWFFLFPYPDDGRCEGEGEDECVCGGLLMGCFLQRENVPVKPVCQPGGNTVLCIVVR